MKIPSQVEHLGHTYDVVYKPSAHDDAEGYVDFYDLKINLDTSLKGSRLEERFFRELCHIAYDSSGLKYIIKDKLDPEATEEMVVDLFSQAVYGLLARNKMI